VLVGEGGVGQVAGDTADHHAEFDLVVGLRTAPGDQDVVVRPDERVRRLQKDRRLGRQRLARLTGMVGII
jgi:hypothetical protein